MNYEAAEKVIRFLDRRGGFDAWWEDIDRDTRQEIKDGLAALLATAEASAQGEAGRWQRAPAELPNSDIVVLIATDDEDARDYSTARLEFTDDSDGNGEPYWALEGGDVAMCNYPNWKPVPPPPKAEP